MRLVFDIETNGLLDTLDRVHSLVLKDVDEQEMTSCTPGDIETGVRILMEADEIIGHNIISFDIPALQKVYPWFKPKGKITDTLVLARLIWPNIKEKDLRRVQRGTLPGNLIGRHSLEAWGYRLHRWKGDYAAECKAAGIDPWAEWSPEMQRYCEQDVEANLALLQKIEKEEGGYSPEAIALETDVAAVCAKIERNGFPFDVPAAVQLYGSLTARKVEIENELIEAFGGWWTPKGEFTPKRTLHFKDPKRDSYIAGCPFTKIEWTEFNPASRDHIANRLINLYGWEPQDFTPGGKPRVDEDVLAELTYPTAPLLCEYFLLQKRIGQLAEGPQAWLKMERNGQIHGSINPNGAVTGRATHSRPNMGQVPSLRSLYGKECRELFSPPKGWFQVGTDMSGLELRCLAHFMARYDGGQYGEILLNGDVHTANQEAADLPTRDMAKTFIYAFLYGAGDAKIGSIVGGGAARGKKLRENFLAKLPALKRLVRAVKDKAKDDRFILGLDKRKLHIRSLHAALNTLLQSAGALLCKKWMVLLEERLLSAGYSHGPKGDFMFMAWVHDELQIAAKTKELADEIGRLSQECAAEAGAFFKFRIPLDAEYKIGLNWAECH